MKEKQETFYGIDGKRYYLTKEQNRNATLESLEAVIKMILAEDEEEFCKYYSMATHDTTKGGHTVWYYMHNEPGYSYRNYTKEYYQKNKEKFKKYREELKKEKQKKVNEEDFNFE